MSTPEIDQLTADIAAVRAARLALAKGERVDEVWREGRRLTMGKVTLEGLSTLIRTMEQDLASMVAADAGTPRRQAIGTYF